MVDWKWFGSALGGSAFLGGVAMYVGHVLLKAPDEATAITAGCVAGVSLLLLIVAKVRYEAWWRQYRLTTDYERGYSGNK